MSKFSKEKNTIYALYLIQLTAFWYQYLYLSVFKCNVEMENIGLTSSL